MRRVFQVFVFVVLLAFGVSFPAWANTWWEKTEDHMPPSCYAGRVYTRQHWVDFYVNESQVGAWWKHGVY